MKCFLLIATSLALASATTDGSPVEKIVKLLENMKATIEGDGKVEQQIYDKYACWCEKTSKRKAQDIVTAQEDLRSLGQRILKLKGKIATRAAEIAELTDNINRNNAEQEAATAVREKQNAAWQAESAEVKQAITALQSAITVLAEKTTLVQKGKGGFIQESQQMQSKNAVKNVLESLPQKVSPPVDKLSMLSEFVSAKAGYAPQSATIQGMLGDMYLTMARNLEDSTQDEADQNRDFEKLYATLEKKNNELKATRARKETEKAEAEAMLADTTKNYDDTEKQMKADTAFFDQTKAACESKHEEWDVRTEMRDEELVGINKALDILSSDKARALFAKSIKPGVETFLQIASTPGSLLQDDATAPASRAYNALKVQLKQSHSIRLAALAVKIRTAKAGHFDGVMKAIDDMVKSLQEEGADDLDKKNQCLDEYQENTKTVKDLDWKIKNNEAKIAKLEKLIELRTQEKEETIQKIKETKQYMKEITEERKEEHDAYKKAKKDDEGALELLELAKKELSKFYKKHADMGKIQGSVKLLQDDPEFEVSADQAPDASFSKKGSHKLESKNVVSLMSYIIEDLQDELANGKKAEAKSQMEYEEEMATAQKLVDDLKEKKVNLKNIISKRRTDKKEENVDKKENNGDRDDELSYKAKIKPDCDWILKAFDGRADARAAEMNGLTTAKEFLAGKTAFVEKSQKFDDTKLQSIGFLSVTH